MVLLVNVFDEPLGVGLIQKKIIRRDYDIGELMRREHKRLNKPRKKRQE